MGSVKVSMNRAVSEEDYRLFLGEKKQDYYLKAFNFLDEFGHETMHCWNWAAFLFGVVWLLYRKMYIPALFYSIVLFVSIMLLVLWPSSALIIFVSIALLLSWPLLGLYGNAIYHSHAKNKIVKAKLSKR